MSEKPDNVLVPLSGGPMNGHSVSVPPGKPTYEAHVTGIGRPKRKVVYVIDWTADRVVGVFKTSGERGAAA